MGGSIKLGLRFISLEPECSYVGLKDKKKKDFDSRIFLKYVTNWYTFIKTNMCWKTYLESNLNIYLGHSLKRSNLTTRQNRESKMSVMSI